MPICQFRKLSPRGIANIKRGLKRSWSEGGTHRLMQQNRLSTDSEAARRRALFDRKGTLLLDRVTITHSVKRANQYDIYVDGQHAFTGGARALADWLQSLSPRSLCPESAA